MAEYWKSTPKYWCKFCEVFVRDTGLERRNHEASGKHQGAIQRSLKAVHKGKQQEEREQQKAKSEVARLNNLVGTKPTTKPAPSVAAPAPARPNRPRFSAPAPQHIDAAAQRRATAEQFRALSLPVPKELQHEASGTGAWHTVSERVVGAQEVPAPQAETAPLSKGVHKRKAEDGDENGGFEPKAKKAWGNKFKSYGDSTASPQDDGDLEALLSGIGQKKADDSKSDEPETASTAVKPDPADKTDDLIVKEEENESAVTAPPVVTFKKRKPKR